MFNFKSIMIFLTALFVSAALALQLLEMKEYNLFETLQQRFLPAKTEAKANAKSTATEPKVKAEVDKVDTKVEKTEDAGE